MGRFQIDDFIAGYLGGAASVIVGHPLDTVKTRLQVGLRYGNTFNCILKIYRNENVLGFFKGMSFPLASIAIYNSVVFGVFSNTQRLICQHQNRDSRKSPDLVCLTVSSMLAGCVSVGIGGPVDLVKIRLQMQTQPIISGKVSINHSSSLLHYQTAYKGPIHCVHSIIKQDGFSGVYRGAGAMILRDIPGYCLYFIPYTCICEWLTKEGHTAPSAASVWIAGGIAEPPSNSQTCMLLRKYNTVNALGSLILACLLDLLFYSLPHSCCLILNQCNRNSKEFLTLQVIRILAHIWSMFLLMWYLLTYFL
ncbi:solute carrier family 25 member 48 isoform 2-T2 [Discoglossus pictus]